MNPRARILIINDGAETAPAWTRALDRAGYEVIQAAPGRAISGLARQCNPDLFLLKMPLSEGNDVCRNIKAEPETMDCMVALVAEREADTDAATDQADDVLFLPLTDRQLVSRIELLLRLKQAQDGQRSTSNRDAYPARAPSQDESIERERYRLVAEAGGSTSVQMETTSYERAGLMRALLDAPTEAMVLLDLQMNILDLNNAAAISLGRPLHTLVNQPLLSLFPPPVARARKARIERVIASGQAIRFEDEREGRIFDNHIYPVFDAQGQVAQVAVFAHDVTQQRRAELARRASEQRLQVALQNSPVMVFSQDQNLHYTWVYNARPVFCSERSLGQVYADLLPPGDAGRLLEIQRAVLETGVESRQIIRIVQEGRPRFYDFTIVPVRDEHGSIVGINSVAVDVTERVRAQQRSRRRQAQILKHNRELVALNRIAIAMSQTYDLQDALFQVVDHLLQAMNFDCGIIQIFADKEPLINCAADRGFSESCREQHLAALSAFIRDRIEQTNRAIIIHDQSQTPPAIAAFLQAEGVRAWLSVRIHTPSRTLGAMTLLSTHQASLTESEMHLLTAVAHQIGAAHENMRLLEQTAQIEMLTRLEALRAELIANVSHELRTPLGLIEIAASSLSSEDIAFDDETRSKFLHIIAQESQRLNALVNNLLGLSRVENKQLIVNKQPVDLDQVILKTRDLMHIQSPERQIIYQPSNLPAPIPADAYALEQILINLLSNAIKYSPPDTPITIRVRQEKEQVVVQVQDRGIGIPEAELKPVFGRFYRGKHERVQQAGGIGLGLAVCRELVRAHGGRIWAESQAGDGTTVSFTLPVPPEPAAAEG